MPRRALNIADPELALVLTEALERGALALPDACRFLRALDGATQAEFAARAGVATKVIKDLEDGSGHPTLASLNRISALIGMRVTFVRSSASIEIESADGIVQRRAEAGRAILQALRLGKVSLKRSHKRNALSGSDFTITMPKLG